MGVLTGLCLYILSLKSLISIEDVGCCGKVNGERESGLCGQRAGERRESIGPVKLR